MIIRKYIIIFILIVSVILTTIITGVDCVIIRDYSVNINDTHGINLYPFYDVFSTFSDYPYKGFEMLLKNIVLGFVVGFIISMVLNLVKVDDKSIKTYIFLALCYISELILFSEFKGTFSIDTIILRYIGCWIGTFILSKIKLKLRESKKI